jgi:predicted phage-related endonuclease
MLEHIVASHYTKRTGNRVRRINAVLQHPDPDKAWMLANIDREVIGANDVQILECKTAGINGARLWKNGVPEYVQVQVMHQLAVTGKAAADVAVLIGGQELRIHRIERDEAQIAALITLERQFWQYVQTDTPPPADGSDSADLALRCLYPQDNGASIDFSRDTHLSSSFADLVALRAHLTEQEKLEAQLKQRLQQAMGDATRAKFETGEVTWKKAKDGTTLDLDRLQKDHPQLVKRYSVPKTGSRRFLFV